MLTAPLAVRPQTIAFLTPDKSDSSKAFASKLEEHAELKLKVLDASLAESAYSSISPATPFSMSTQEAKRVGMTIGCDAFVLVRSATQRRSAFQRAEYYESYAVIYVVSARTGKLILWKLQQFEAPEPKGSAKLLNDSVGVLSKELETSIKNGIRSDLTAAEPPSMEEFPDETSPLFKSTRAPVPYRRIKPEYTSQASLYDVKATVDLMVYLDEKGTIVKTETVRWAGFGLDESVERNVRSMNWRPAERNGKPLAMNFLVRYNFKKID